MEASIICKVVGNDNILKIKEEDIGKCILVINQIERGYCQILLDGTEAYSKKNCIKLKPFRLFFGELTNKEAVGILSSDAQKFAIISLEKEY